MSFLFFFFLSFLRQDFFVALKPVLELALVNQADLDSQISAYLCLTSAGIKGVHHHCPVHFLYPSFSWEIYRLFSVSDYYEQSCIKQSWASVLMVGWTSFGYMPDSSTPGSWIRLIPNFYKVSLFYQNFCVDCRILFKYE